MWNVLQWVLLFIVSLVACIVIGMLVTFIFNAMYPNTCTTCEQRKRDAVVHEATQNEVAVMDDGGDDI